MCKPYFPSHLIHHIVVYTVLCNSVSNTTLIFPSNSVSNTMLVDPAGIVHNTTLHMYYIVVFHTTSLDHVNTACITMSPHQTSSCIEYGFDSISSIACYTITPLCPSLYHIAEFTSTHWGIHRSSMNELLQQSILDAFSEIQTWNQQFIIDDSGKSLDLSSATMGKQSTTPSLATNQPTTFPHRSVYRFDATQYKGMDSFSSLVLMIQNSLPGAPFSFVHGSQRNRFVLCCSHHRLLEKRLVRPTLSQKVTSHKMESGKNTSSDPHPKLDYLALILWQANKNQE